MTTQSTSLRFADALVAQPFSWPGLYQRVGITSDGGVLCPDCCRSERAAIGTTTGSDGWCLVGIDTLWDDGFTCCSHCGRQLPEPLDDDDSSEALTAAERNPSLAAA